jgi:hypothetical protein
MKKIFHYLTNVKSSEIFPSFSLMISESYLYDFTSKFNINPQFEQNLKINPSQYSFSCKSQLILFDKSLFQISPTPISFSSPLCYFADKNKKYFSLPILLNHFFEIEKFKVFRKL